MINKKRFGKKQTEKGGQFVASSLRARPYYEYRRTCVSPPAGRVKRSRGRLARGLLNSARPLVDLKPAHLIPGLLLSREQGDACAEALTNKP